jgi:hypothetical protein
MKLRMTAAIGVVALSVAALSLGAAAANAGTVQVTGHQLEAALLPASDFPVGYQASGESDTGSRLETSPAKYNLPTMSCATWEQEFGLTGFGETAAASDSIDPPSRGATRDAGYAQLVYQFRTAGVASTFFRGTRAVAAAPVGGHAAFWIDETVSASGYTVQGHALLTDVGTDVYGIESLGIGIAPPASPAPASLTLKLIARVQALR